MLIFTGILPKSKRSVTEEQLSAKEAMEEFDVPEMGAHAELELSGNFKKKNKLTGEVRVGRQQTFAPVYSLDLPGLGQVQVRYAESRVAKATGGYEYRLTNDRISNLRSEKTVFRNGADIEIYVFLFLHPRNGANPWRSKNKQAIFTHIDREAEANRRLASMKLADQVRLEILEMDKESLRVMASGLSYKVNGMDVLVPGLDNVGVSQLRAMLLDRLAAHGDAFVAAWRSGNNTLHGMLQYAVDSDIIKLKKTPGLKYWSWNTDTHKDVPIVNVGATEPEMAALRRVFAEHNGDLFPILKLAIDTKRTKSIVLPGEASLDTLDGLTLGVIQSKGIPWIVDQCVLNDLIGYDRASKKVRFITAGDYTTDILEVNVSAKWREELEAALGKVEYRSERAGLCTRLFHFLRPDAPVNTVAEPLPEPVAVPESVAAPETTTETIIDEPEPEIVGAEE